MPLFGFGKNKKEKEPFKTPREVISLRNRIDSQMHENFPNLAHYRELADEVELVCRNLNAVIARNEHAEEAARLRDDLAARLSRLAAKISKNRRAGAGKEECFDKLDSLQRESVRNTAERLFMDFLEHVASFRKCCMGERIEHDRTLESISRDIINTVDALKQGFFKQHVTNPEIDSMKREVAYTAGELNDFMERNRPAISANGLEARATAAVTNIMNAVKDI